MFSIPAYNNLLPADAIALQKKLQEKINLTPTVKKIQLIGGADISFNKHEETVYAGIITLSFPDLIPVEQVAIKIKVTFPYIPGLLAFREVPAIIKALNHIKQIPDVLIMDGHGYAHNRRMGIATHLGVLTDMPTIGCAKSKLVGDYKEPANIKFATSILSHKKEQIGIVMRSKLNCKPVFISPGNKTDFEQSIEIMKHCTSKYRIPEPTRQAHNYVNECRKGLMPVLG